MKRVTQIPTSKILSIGDILPVIPIGPRQTVKPFGLKAAYYKICLLAMLCFLLPGYISTVNWNEYAAVINEKCLAIPAFVDAGMTKYEHKITAVFARFLQVDTNMVAQRGQR